MAGTVRESRLITFQASWYLLSLAAGIGLGAVIADAGAVFSAMIPVFLVVVLYLTFLSIPFSAIREGFADLRFLVILAVVNFVAVPLVVWVLSLFLSERQDVLLGFLFVLLCPCVDYVIFFTGMAQGAKDRLLAAAPLLLIAQMALLPLFLWWMAGPETVSAISWQPFVEALLLYVVVPFLAAWATQRFLRGRANEEILLSWGEQAMVPFMCLVLVAVAASQTAYFGSDILEALVAVPLFVAFALIMLVVGYVVTVRRMPAPQRAAVMLSGMTRNSLVVLPLALAVSSSYPLAAATVVMQTFTELCVLAAVVPVIKRVFARQRVLPAG